MCSSMRHSGDLGRAVSFDHAVPIVGITRRLWVEEAIHSLSTGGAFLVQLPIH